MADVHSSTTRSYNMSRIRSKHTKPELLVRSCLHREGFRFRLHAQQLPGKPDIVLPKFKTVIFVHGCFWHGHAGCRYFVVPKTRTDWWLNKINTNKGNDRKAIKALRKLGWRVLEVWECRIKVRSIEKTMRRLADKIRSPHI